MNVAWVVLHCNRRIGARERRQLIPHVRFQVPFLGPESQLKSGFACAGLLCINAGCTCYKMLGKELLSGLWERPECVATGAFFTFLHVRRPDGSVGMASVLPALIDCRWWFKSLLVHSGVSSATPKGNGRRPQKQIHLFACLTSSFTCMYHLFRCDPASSVFASMRMGEMSCRIGCTLWSLGSWLGHPGFPQCAFLASLSSEPIHQEWIAVPLWPNLALCLVWMVCVVVFLCLVFVFVVSSCGFWFVCFRC